MKNTAKTRWLTSATFALLGACSILPTQPRVALYTTTPQFAPGNDSTRVDWRLGLARIEASGPLTTPRILVRPVPGEIEVYPQAEWSEPAPGLIAQALMQALEADARIPHTGHIKTGLAHDMELATELRDFHIELSPDPTAVVRIKAQLIAWPEGRLITSRVFQTHIPATSQQTPDAVTALTTALEQTLPQIVDWTVAHGQQHWLAKGSER